MPHDRTRRLSIALLALLTIGLPACAPEPAPTPTPTPAFANEEEAFAAAEETYRAYIDALNDVNFADPATFDDVYDDLAGDAASAAREMFSQYHAEGISVKGETRFSEFVGIASDQGAQTVEASVCLDVRDVEVFDIDGSSLVGATRPGLQLMRLSLRADSSGELPIISMQASGDAPCAG